MENINNPRLIEGGNKGQSCVLSSAAKLVTGRAGSSNLLEMGKSMRERDMGHLFQPAASEEEVL